jgi:hypothetical protein
VTRFALALLAAGGAAAALATGAALDARRPAGSGFEGDSLEVLALGGFRPLAIDLLQARADLDYRRGRDYALLADLDLLLRLQPKNEELWTFTVYHIAFNLPSLEATEEGQRRWVERALDYAKEGLKRFPASSIVHALFGFVCIDVVTRHPVLVDSFARSEGRSPAQAAAEAYERAVELGPGDLQNWLWAIECRRTVAWEELQSSRFETARAQFERMADLHRRIRDRFGEPGSIASRHEAENTNDWMDVCRCLEREGTESTAARERLRGMRSAYPWDRFIGPFLEQLEGETPHRR